MKQFLAVLILSLSFGAVKAQTAPSDDSLLSDELTLAEASSSTQIVNEKPHNAKKFYASAVVGMSAYPDVSNVQNGYNVAGAIGFFLNESLMIDVGVGLAKSQLSVRNLLFNNKRDNFDINIYQANLAAKYQFDGILGTGFKPIAGVAAAYSYRQYNLRNGSTANSGDTGSSTALDAGVTAGLNYDFNSSFALGLDFKFMANMSSKVNSNYTNPVYGYTGIPLESLQYYIAGISARMIF